MHSLPKNIVFFLNYERYFGIASCDTTLNLIHSVMITAKLQMAKLDGFETVLLFKLARNLLRG